MKPETKEWLKSPRRWRSQEEEEEEEGREDLRPFSQEQDKRRMKEREKEGEEGGITVDLKFHVGYTKLWGSEISGAPPLSL